MSDYACCFSLKHQWGSLYGVMEDRVKWAIKGTRCCQYFTAFGWYYGYSLQRHIDLTMLLCTWCVCCVSNTKCKLSLSFISVSQFQWSYQGFKETEAVGALCIYMFSFCRRNHHNREPETQHAVPVLFPSTQWSGIGKPTWIWPWNRRHP